MATNKRAFLIILDGWGINHDPEVSAIEAANTPFFDSLCKKYANATLTTYGSQVGLPDGQMGNSEVGHLNIGAGRIVFQELARINNAISDGELGDMNVLREFLAKAQERGGKLHLMGLLSDGGVHSHINHLKALCDIIEQGYNIPTYIHAFTDGRDVDPKSGLGFVNDIEQHVADTGIQLASLIGRYYAMDRDKRWERTRKAYDMLVRGTGLHTESIAEAVAASYEAGVTDEFIDPIVKVDTSGNPLASVEEGDSVLFFNFRTDRPRQLVTVLTQSDIADQEMSVIPDLSMLTMTQYDETYKGLSVLFTNNNIEDTMGEVIMKSGRTQLRIAETEKYPHVTFFFNGGREETFEGEDRIMVPSPKVATYDLQPSMSAHEVTEKVMEAIATNTPDFICLNFANTDMVGHTGVFSAAIEAAETVDHCLSQIVPLAMEHDYGMIIIADHGNSDVLVNPDGSPNTAHSMKPVPVIFVTSANGHFKVRDGILADVAPTLLDIMGVDQPELMTGSSLISD